MGKKINFVSLEDGSSFLSMLPDHSKNEAGNVI